MLISKKFRFQTAQDFRVPGNGMRRAILIMLVILSLLIWPSTQPGAVIRESIYERVDKVVLYCEIESDPGARTSITQNDLCRAAAIALEHLATGRLNAQILKLPGWHRALDGHRGSDESLQFDKMHFQLRIVNSLSTDLLRDSDTLFVWVRARVLKSRLCGIQRTAIVLAWQPLYAQRVLEFFPGAVREMLRPKAPGIVCHPIVGVFLEYLIDELKLVYCTWFVPSIFNTLNRRATK